MYYNLCEFIKDELKDLDKKAASGGKLSMTEIEYADKLAHIKKSLLTVDAMENPDEYRDDDRYGARKNNRRYSARYHDDMMHDLHELMDKAPNDDIKRKYRDFISEMERM